MTVDSWVRVVRRHARVVGGAAAVGLVAGVSYAALTPPMYAATSQVVLPGVPVSAVGQTSRDVETNVRIAGSATVLRRAAEDAGVDVSLRELHDRVRVHAVTTDILTVEGRGETAVEARNLADAVADAYVAYAWSTDASAASAAATTPAATARVLEYAPEAFRAGTRTRIVTYGALGALAAAALTSLTLVLLLRHDRRLRLRDEIADAVGLPVVATVQSAAPQDAGGWVRLLAEYRPAPADAWSLRNALRSFGPGEGRPHTSLTVVSIAGDSRALAVGPQLAAFTAARGIDTALLVPTQDPSSAGLRTACSAAVADAVAPNLVAREDAVDDGMPTPAFTVVVVVVDPEGSPPDGPATDATMVAVTAGAATAADLAQVAVGLVDSGRDVIGLVVADPDPEDRTSGRVPSAARRAPVAVLPAGPARVGRR